jgi:hypothetical protein
LTAKACRPAFSSSRKKERGQIPIIRAFDLDKEVLQYKINFIGTWRSLEAHLNGVQGARGSNPRVPTMDFKSTWIHLIQVLLFGYWPCFTFPHSISAIFMPITRRSTFIS